MELEGRTNLDGIKGWTTCNWIQRDKWEGDLRALHGKLVKAGGGGGCSEEGMLKQAVVERPSG